MVQPEGHPRYRDGHRAGNVDGHHEEGELADEEQLDSETRVGAGGGDDVAVLAAEGAKLEASRQGEVRRKLDRVALFPDVDQVVLRPTVCN